MKKNEIKEFLDEKVEQYNNVAFIHSDPIQIPHLFSNTNDIEIAAFLCATLAWGQRKTIINKSTELMNLMDNSPADFISNFKNKDLKRFNHFVHRTFCNEDCIFFMQSLQNIYKHHGGIQSIFNNSFSQNKELKKCIAHFREIFFSIPFPHRTTKHFSDVTTQSAAKRINMFLRWMIRNDKKGVDFGIWKNIPPAALYIPLDLHTGNISRKLKILKRQQNDWYAVEELTSILRNFDPVDPIKYDFALFGLGAFESF